MSRRTKRKREAGPLSGCKCGLARESVGGLVLRGFGLCGSCVCPVCVPAPPGVFRVTCVPAPPGVILPGNVQIRHTEDRDCNIFYGDAQRLARRAPRPQALPSPTGLCAGFPAGRSADSVRTTELLGTRAGRLHCDAAQAGPSQACTRSSGCSPAAGMLVVLRAGVPALPQAVGEDGERAAGQ